MLPTMYNDHNNAHLQGLRKDAEQIRQARQVTRKAEAPVTETTVMKAVTAEAETVQNKPAAKHNADRREPIFQFSISSQRSM